MNCYYCKGVDTMEAQNTRFCAYDIPAPFVMENVPASVCRLCGDKSYSGNVVTALEKIKNGKAQVSGFQTFRVFDFKQLDKSKEYGADSSADFSITDWFQKLSFSHPVERLNREAARQHIRVFFGPTSLTHTESQVVYVSTQLSPREPMHHLCGDIQSNKTRHKIWQDLYSVDPSRTVGSPSYDLEGFIRVNSIGG